MLKTNGQRLIKRWSKNHDRHNEVPFMGDEIIDGISALDNEDLIKDFQDRLSGFAHARPEFLGMPVNWPFRSNLTNTKMLEKEPYLMVPKPKGVRCLLYIDTRGEMFLENNTHKRHIFKLDHDRAPQLNANDTVLNGIVVRKKNRDGEANGKLAFVIMDAIRYLGEDLTQKNVQERIYTVQVKIIKPCSDDIRNGIIEIEHEVFHLDIARYEDKSLIGKFLTLKS